MKQIVILLLLALLLSCGTSTTGTSSEVDIEYALVNGVVVDKSGAPIVDASMKLFSSEDTNAVDSTNSSATGAFQFENVKPGNYRITASAEDSLSAQLSSLIIPEQPFADTTVDTLWMVPPGVIRGSIKEYDGMGLILVYIPGTSYIATVNSSGFFEMTGIAPGEGYSVVFDRFGYLPVRVSGIAISSGDTLTLEPQSLTPNMYPQNLQASYDTVANTVTLSWDTLARPDIAGYVVSRKDANKSALLPVELHDEIVTVTNYIDTLHDTLFSQSDTIDLQYQVQGQISPTNERTGYSIPVTVRAVISRDSSDYQSISLLSPAVGDTIAGLEKTDIVWHYTGKIDSVQIFLTLDGGDSWSPLGGTQLNKGTYSWSQITNAESDNCQIKVINSANSAVLGMSGQFSISLTPIDNMFQNGDFSQGLKGWVPRIHNYDSTVDASIEVVDEQLYAKVNKGIEQWKIAMVQYPLTPIYAKYEYEVIFKAKASLQCNVAITIHENVSPYEHFGETNALIDTSWQEYRLKISPYGDPSGDNTVVNFSFGDGPKEIWFDDFSFNIAGVQ